MKINVMNELKQIYNSLPNKEKKNFRLNVCFKCGWTTSQTFYNKMSGKTEISKLELEAIKKLK